MSTKSEETGTLPISGVSEGKEVGEIKPDLPVDDGKAKDVQSAVPPAKAPTTSISVDMADELAERQYEETARAGLPTAKVLQVMESFAKHVVATGQMPSTIDSAAKVLIVLEAGRELGVPPMKALYSFYFVNNKLTMYGPTVIERIRGWARIEYGTCDEKEANVTIIRKDDGTKLASRVTMEDLQARGLTDRKDTFKKHPRTMLIYKAVGEIVRHIVPEAVGSMAVEGDWNDSAESEIKGRAGKIVDVVPVSDNEGEIPSARYIATHYDREVIVSRLEELGVKDVEGTKSKLAAQLVDALKAKKNETV